MASEARDLLGGGSIYNVNLTRVERAVAMAYDDPDSGPRIRASLSRLETELDSKERAAIALVVIDRLIRNLSEGEGG